jgi:hypothetical protein
VTEAKRINNNGIHQDEGPMRGAGKKTRGIGSDVSLGSEQWGKKNQ